MKQPEDKINNFFVDESGDTTFYDRYGNLALGKEGVSKTLILGFIMTDNPKPIRNNLIKLRREIAADKYLKGIPSLKKTMIAFHAKDDCPEVRERVFKVISNLDYTAEVIVARKIPTIFNRRHHRKENEFYDDLIAKLFENKLHLATHNEIFFSVRGSKTRQLPLQQAIEKAISRFEEKWNTEIKSTFKINPHRPSGEPCLQVVDYINWAVQKAFEKGQDRFIKFVEDKISYLVDIYDQDKYPNNFYNRKNRLDLTKISPL